MPIVILFVKIIPNSPTLKDIIYFHLNILTESFIAKTWNTLPSPPISSLHAEHLIYHQYNLCINVRVKIIITGIKIRLGINPKMSKARKHVI